MDQKPKPIETIAMAEYSLDLGIPIVDFIMRLRLAGTEEEARQLLSDSKFFINDICLNTPDYVIYKKDVSGGAVISAGGKKVRIIIWVDGD